MDENKRYWFPAKAPGHGWGWGLPQVWQGWAVLAALFVLLVAGLVVLIPYGQWMATLYACVLGGVLIGVAVWKGEPQSTWRG